MGQGYRYTQVYYDVYYKYMVFKGQVQLQGLLECSTGNDLLENFLMAAINSGNLMKQKKRSCFSKKFFDLFGPSIQLTRFELT